MSRARRSPLLCRLSGPVLCTSLAAGLGLWLATPAVQAQNLQELHQAARSYDAAYLSARAQAEAAEYRLAQTRALLRPSLGLTGSATHSETEGTTRAFNGSYPTENRQLGLAARQPLVNLAHHKTIEQAESSLDIARTQLQATEQDLIVRVSQAYFDVLAAHDTLATVRASKAAIAEQLAAAKRNFEVGTATITDAREAQARFDLATAQEVTAENELRLRRLALDQLVGRQGIEPHRLATQLQLPALAPADLGTWVQLAENGHPGVRRASLELAIAQLEIDKARAGHLPTLDLVGNVAHNRNNYGTSAPPNLQVQEGRTTTNSIGLQLNFPLFSGFSVQNRVRETVALEDKARNDLEAARRGVAQATRQAFLGVQSGLGQVRALEAAEASSQLALEATQLGYKVGVRVGLDVLNAQTQLFTTRRDLSQARYNVVVGGLKLRQAAGVLGPDDVAAVNRLLTP